MSRLSRVGFITIVFVLTTTVLQAQCAMCRTTLENNVSNGNIGIAAGINFGILYLFAAPYLVIALIAFFWFKTSKRNSDSDGKRSIAG